MQDGKQRALQSLTAAASLQVVGDTLRIVNLTGHKLISGYPEGRRMWLNIKWYDQNDNLVREDGEYGELSVSGIPGVSKIKTLLNLADPNRNNFV